MNLLSPLISTRLQAVVGLAPTGRLHTSPGQSEAPPWVGPPERNQSPEGAFHDSRVARNGPPLQGFEVNSRRDLGRCPRLVWKRPVGAEPPVIITRFRYAGRRPPFVAQVSKPAVSPISKSAARASFEARPTANAARVWKPATQQTWKSALHGLRCPLLASSASFRD